MNGKQKIISLGVYPETTLQKARDRRGEARANIINGIDPKVDMFQQEEGVPTFGSVEHEWFTVKSIGWVPRYSKSIRERLDKYLFPNLCNKSFAELVTHDLLAVLRRIESESKFEMAHLVAQIYGQICRFAKLAGIISSNPVEGISALLSS